MKTWMCHICGSRDLQVTAWITMNGEKIVNSDPPTDQIWCPVCDAEVGAEEAPGVETPVKEPLWAFWEYDLYPYVLSGEVTKMRPVAEAPDRVEYWAASYRMWVMNCTVLRGEDGARTAAGLRQLRDELGLVKDGLHREYLQKAVDLAPFLHGKRGYTNPSLRPAKEKP